MAQAPSLAALLRDTARIQKQEQFAAIGALNDTAFECMKAVRNAMPIVFDRPRPETVRAVVYDQAGAAGATRSATPLDRRFGAPSRIFVGGAPLEARIYLSDYIYDAEKRALRPEILGGVRGLKGAERRMQQVGIMQPGQFMVPSRELLQQGNLVDQYGNVRGPFIRGLLSYLQAFSTPGFAANSSQRTIDKIAAKGRGPRGFVTINGVQYFVSKGRGERTSAGFPGGRGQHLPAGIWAKRGTGGARIYPVFLFVRAPIYKVRLEFDTICRNVAQRTFPAKLAERRARAFSTAR